MAIRHSEPVRFTPRGVCDSIDGENSPPGAMSSLKNLLFDPSTSNIFACRPANMAEYNFSDFANPGVVSVMLQVGDIIYGMVSTTRNSGRDEPFAYNNKTNNYIALSGAITAGTTPTTQPTTGEWTPPSMTMVGQRVIVTHPGFNYSGGIAFGYFDLSGYSNTFSGDIVSGSNIINGNFPVSALGPGYLLSGTGIPTGTIVKNYSNVSLSVAATTNSSTSITGIASTTGMYVGQSVSGTGIPTGATITAINSSTAITISSAATTSASITLFVTGTTITMTQNATASTNNLSITVTGGSTSSPLWCVGNTTGALQLPSLPQCVGQFNNRVYFGVKNAAIYTDTLSLNISNSPLVQVLILGDTTNINALVGLPLSTTQNGIIQSLIAFKTYSTYQITGDASSGTLASPAMNLAVGSKSPRSICPVTDGLMFVALDGVRLINFSGVMSEPDGDLRLPFIETLYASRISAAFNANIYRVSLQNGNISGTPKQEYWFDFLNGGWTGPHTFTQDMAVPYQNYFVLASNDNPGILWNSYTLQNVNSTGDSFTENGTPLSFTYQTSPMPDLGIINSCGASESTFTLSFPGDGSVYAVNALNESLEVIANASLRAPLTESIWLQFIWGLALWGSGQYGLKPIIVPWTTPLTFNKLIIQLSGPSSLAFRVGSYQIMLEELGYISQ